jgi:hypothetical protein
MLFKIPLGTRMDFFEICKQFGDAPAEKVRQLWPSNYSDRILLPCHSRCPSLHGMCVGCSAILLARLVYKQLASTPLI